ncbi:MAG: hypothetical protein ACFB16_26195, partial [Phormidesmis sp.]
MKGPTVPQLDLAPKRRKLLSLWNPLDYLQLLSWVFFFPQAVRWYVETLCEKQALNNCATWAERRWWWKNSPKQRSFWLQGLLLTMIAPAAITWILSSFEVSTSLFGVAFVVALIVQDKVEVRIDEGSCECGYERIYYRRDTRYN